MRAALKTLTLGIALIATASLAQAAPPAHHGGVTVFPSVGGTGNVPIYNNYLGNPYLNSAPYGTYYSYYNTPFGRSYNATSFYSSPFGGFSTYSNSGATATPFGYSYYRNGGSSIAPGAFGPGFSTGYSTGATVTPWFYRTYGYGY